MLSGFQPFMEVPFSSGVVNSLVAQQYLLDIDTSLAYIIACNFIIIQQYYFSQ